jgi:predicted dehydrogenase
MTQVRLGIIGLGNIGNFHAANVTRDAAGGASGNGPPPMTGVRLAAVCDNDPARVAAAVEKYGKGKNGPVAGFTAVRDLLAARACDAVLVATPHFDHVPAATAAFAAGVHVLVEKPLAVSIHAARQVVAAHAKTPRLVFGIMYNQRANPLYQKMRELIAAGELGALSRVTWLVTNWFRTWAYYASGGWRATWAGEGGGVLINQCPHNLDLLGWITGLAPRRATAVAFAGKTHPIEVEDEVSAVIEFAAPDGAAPAAVGHFVTTTGEYPGTNRLEICGSRGKLVAEDGRLTFRKVSADVNDVLRTATEAFVTPDVVDVPVAVPPLAMPEHQYLLQDFVNVVRAGGPSDRLLAPAADGVRGLELGNALVMAGLTRTPVDFPLDGPTFDAFLADMARSSGGRKPLPTRQAVADVAASF